MLKSRGKTASADSGSGRRNYVEIARAYAEEAVADVHGAQFGKWVRLAAKRFLHDLERAKQPGAPFTFDGWHAEDACGFIEELPHVEGKWDTDNIVLHPAHVFFVVNLFGFRNPNGGRRFSTALFAIARKNAKSTLAAAILLYCLCCEEENGPQVISAATTGSQARIVWNIAKRMVEKLPELREAFSLSAFANAIARYDVGGTFKPINAKASTQDGLNPSHTNCDEIHAHKSSDLLNVLQSAAGARGNPLWLYTTTEGYENPGPWPEIRHFARQVLEGVIEADHFLALFFALDKDDSEFDESKWVKANPLLEANPLLLKELRKAAIDAKAMPGRMAEFRIKRCNMPSASADGWVDLQAWARCGGAVDLAELEGLPCWGAFDLASTRDMNAWRLLWQRGAVWYTWGRYWVPEAAVKQRTERNTAPYQSWTRAGFIQQTEGDVADYAAIENDIAADCERFRPQQIAYDTWNATDLANRLVAREFPLVKFIQGPKSYNPAMTALELAYIQGNLRHADNPVLRWNASNLIARKDANMNLAPDKKRSPEKIDGMVSLLMCFGIAVTAVKQDDPYATRGIRTL